MAVKEGRRRRLPWHGLALEFLSVLLGVLAAFAVDEWRADRSARQRARVALANITREIEANRDHLRVVRAANQELAAREPAASGATESWALAWGLQRTAWEVARNTGAIDAVEYEVVLSLSSLYQFQQTYLDLIHGLASAQMVAILSSEEQDLGEIETAMNLKMRLYLDLLTQNEDQLLGWYERSLDFARPPATG